MSQKFYYTQAALQKVRSELDVLQTKDRKAISEQIKEAMDQGDLGENAEYHAAKEAQGFLEMKIAALQDQVAQAKIIDESKINTSKASILTKVRVKEHQTGETIIYKLVSPNQANIKEGTLSITSLVGKGLLNTKVGDIVTVNVPAGPRTFEVLAITI